MNSQDLMNNNNERGFVIDELIEFCTKHGLDYIYTADSFRIPLPTTEPLPTAIEQAKRPGNKRKKLDMDKLFPSNGIIEGEDELPPPDKPLQEGETPDEF